jgi:protein SCO1/2
MNQTTGKRPNYLLFGIGIAVFSMGLGVILWTLLFGPGKSSSLPPDLAATYLPEGRPVVGVQMTDHNNQPFDESRFKGKWSFLFFGFTHCPDVCPAALLIMKAVWNKLPEDARQAPEPQMIFVSVDPDRDTPEILKQYVQFYHPDFIGITGKHDKLDILTTQLSALYGYEDAEGGNGYTVTHSAQIILIDPDGHMRAVFTTPHNVDAIVKGFVSVRDYHKGGLH